MIDYSLPKVLIAQKPAKPRSFSRLMILNGNGEKIEHRRFYNILDYLSEGDVLVLNDTKVMPARLSGRKSTGGKVECLLVQKGTETWSCLLRGKNLHEGTEISFGSSLSGIITEKNGKKCVMKFSYTGDFEKIIKKIGTLPTPPYIKEKVADKNSYQTIYASKLGSIAAPTAGLHFTKELLRKIKKKNVKIASLTLHVGLGTFMPVRAEDISKHKMEPEYFEISEGTARTINKREGRLFVVGTTTLKALETSCDKDGRIKAASGWSELFIYPPYKFKTPVDALITNFHLPKSAPLMLVRAFTGEEKILNAYKIAIERGYRFYSFGDAMLIFRRLSSEV